MTKIDKLNNAYKQVFSSDEGILILEDLKNRYFVNGTTFNPELGTESTIYREGQRAVVLDILARFRRITK